MTNIAIPAWVVALVLFSVAAAVPGYAGEGDAAPLSIEQAVMARQIEDRAPLGEGTTFPADIGQVACYTKVTGAREETFVEHVWLRGEVESARVRLPVRSPAWRTWSTRQIRPEWTGEWSVRIEDAEGRVLDTLRFTIDEGSGPGSEE